MLETVDETAVLLPVLLDIVELATALPTPMVLEVDGSGMTLTVAIEVAVDTLFVELPPGLLPIILVVTLLLITGESVVLAPEALPEEVDMIELDEDADVIVACELAVPTLELM